MSSIPTQPPVSDALAEQMVEHALSSQRRRLAEIDGWIFVFRVAAALLIVPLAAVLLDHNLPDGLPRRVIAGAGIAWGVLILAGLVTLRLRAVRRRPLRMFIARDLEQTYDIRHNLLVNAVQIQADPDRGYAEPIANRQTAVALQQARLVRPAGPLLRRQAAPLLLVLTIWVLYATLGPKSIWPSLARFFGLGMAAPTATTLQWIRPTPDDELYLDRPLEIVVATDGRPVERVTLERFESFDQPAVFESDLRPGIGNARPQLWRVTLAPHELTPAFRYRISAGDARLEGLLEIQEPVQLSAWHVDLTPPAYTGAPPRTIEGTDVLAWEGTQAVFHLRANAPVRDPIFVFATERGEQRTRMRPDPEDPRHATFTRTLDESGTFRAVFRDEFGRSALPGPPGRVTVRIDDPPVVAILKPAREEITTRIDVAFVPRVEIGARDDVGLARVAYVLERDGRATRGQLLETPRRSLDLDWSLTEIEVAVGEEVRLWFEAEDNRVRPDGTPAAQTARSRALVLTRSPPLEPEPGVGSGEGTGADGAGDDPGESEGDGGGQSDSGTGDGEGDREGQGNDAPGSDRSPDAAGEGSGSLEPPQGGQAASSVDTDQQGRAGQASGPGDGRGDGGGEGVDGPGPAEGQTAGPSDTLDPEAGDTPGGDGDADARGPGGIEGDADLEDFRDAVRDFAERFGDEARAVRDQEQDAEQDPQEAGEREPAAEQQAEEQEPSDPRGADADARPGDEEDQQDPAPAGNAPEAEGADAGEEAAEGTSGAASEQQPEAGDQPRPPSEAGDAGDPGEAAEGGGQPPADPGAGEPAEEPGENPAAELAEELQAVLDLLEQDDPLTPEDLEAAGLRGGQAQAFVDALERLRGLTKTSRVIGDPRLIEVGALPEGGSPIPFGETDGIGRGIAAGNTVAERVRRIVAPGDERAPPALEAVLDAYYRSMAEFDAGRVADPGD